MPLKYVSNALLHIIVMFLVGTVSAHPFTSLVTSSNTSKIIGSSLSINGELEDFADLAVIDGDLLQYHKLTLTWDGPNLTEEDMTFSDYRLDVIFTSPTGKTYTVPGYFAADGNAGETSAISGNKWRCHFNALEIGEYTYEVSFRTGTNVAVGFDMNVGLPVAPVHGDTGTFTIGQTNKSGVDFRSKGKLEYVGEHFMRWTNGEYFLKVGSNSPENLFEYGGFDDSNSTRTFPDHIADWNVGDPTWKGSEGQGIIGVMNYLTSKGINSQYFVMHRKGERATPWSSPSTSYATYDVSKLDQWQIVMDHMTEKGLMAHLVFSESTNQSIFEVDSPSGDPSFSDVRKIYFREIVARFGYLNAVTWNIGEENGWDRRSLEWTGEEARGLTIQQQLDFATYIDELAYYDDFITVHNGHSTDTRIFDQLQGDNSFTGISMQGFFNVDNLNVERSKRSTEQYLNESTLSGKKWVVYYDEGFSFDPFPQNPLYFRQNVLWPTLTSGGAGIEHFTTRDTDTDGNQIVYDVILEDLRFSEVPFTQMQHAYDFYIDNAIPFQNMYNQDEIVDNGWCHGDNYKNYVIYVLAGDAGTTTIDLVTDYEVKWYNPRTGGPLVDGTVTILAAGTDLDIGFPPSELDSDWVIYLKSVISGPIPVTGIELNPQDFHLGVGISYTLDANVLPVNADERGVIWSSSDPSIVTVDSNGTVFGVAPGTAIISAETVDGGFVAQSTITITDDVGSCVASGSILMEKYDNIPGEDLIELLNAPIYPDSPTSVDELTIFEIPSRVGDDYGIRVSGFLCAPETGLYTFWISGDNDVQLNLSSDNQFQNIQDIAGHTAFTNEREWNKYTSQRSVEILLFQGESYYIEALMKESAFGDHMSVGWRKPSDGPGNEPSEVIPGSVLSTVEAGRTAVTGIDLNVQNADLLLGETVQLLATVIPANASDKSVVWASDDPSIVSIDQNGNVLGELPGTTTISVTTVDGGFAAQATINVIDDAVISVTGVTVTPTETNLVIDGTLVLEATVDPINATNTSVIWTSANPSIVSVDTNGELLGISFGTTIITVTTVDGGFVAQTTVTVVENSQVNVTGVDLNLDSADLEIGQTIILEATVVPVNATNTAVIWSSEDDSIASVDVNGEILGVAVGSTVISATTEDGNYIAQATITVVEPAVISVTGISISPDSSDLELEASLVFEVLILPIDATDKEVVWSSDDISIAYVDENGEVLGVSLGTTIISVTTSDGEFVARSTITVVEKTEENDGNIKVTGISIDIEDLELYERDLVKINATVLPENASNDYILWVPEDLSIITVDSNGNVEAKKVGETILTATTLDGGFSKSITVTVLPNDIIVYPNPTNDFINITGIDERVGVFIHNASGVLVKTVKGGNPIYVGDLSNASYLIILSTGDRIRFVKR